MDYIKVFHRYIFAHFSIYLFLLTFIGTGYASAQQPSFDLKPYKKTVKYNKSFDYSDAFREELLSTGELYLLKTSDKHRALLVIEKNYLTAHEIQWVSGEIAEALNGVSKLLNRPYLEKNIITYYIVSDTSYGAKILSYAAPIGSNLGTWGIMLKYVKEKEAPVFHETAHLAEPMSPIMPNSLSEGIADYAQQAFRPGLPYAFVPQNIDVNAAARRALKLYDQIPEFKNTIGSQAPYWPKLEEMDPDLPSVYAFYFTSHSFVNFLVYKYGLEKVLQNLEANSTEQAYLDIFQVSLSSLKDDWAKSLFSSYL